MPGSPMLNGLERLPSHLLVRTWVSKRNLVVASEFLQIDNSEDLAVGVASVVNSDVHFIGAEECCADEEYRCFGAGPAQFEVADTGFVDDEFIELMRFGCGD